MTMIAEYCCGFADVIYRLPYGIMCDGSAGYAGRFLMTAFTNEEVLAVPPMSLVWTCKGKWT